MSPSPVLLFGLGVVVVVSLVPGVIDSIAFYALIIFVLGIAHAGVRIGRKTHIVDMAGGDRKAEYIALSNTIIGLVLLVIGAATSAILGFGLEVAIVVLSIMAIFGAVMALYMENVQS